MLGLSLCLSLAACGGPQPDKKADENGGGNGGIGKPTHGNDKQDVSGTPGDGSQKLSDQSTNETNRPNQVRQQTGPDTQNPGPSPNISSSQSNQVLSPNQTSLSANINPTTTLGKDGSSEDVIGMVFDIRGDWTAKEQNGDTKFLHQYDLIKREWVLTPAKPSDLINIQLIDHSEVTLNGGKKSNHPVRLDPRSAAIQPSAMPVWRQAFVRMHDNPTQYEAVNPMAGALTDSVLKLADDQVDLSPALLRMPAGLVNFTLAAVVNGKASDSVLGPFSCEWHNKITYVKLANYKPGLYEMSATGADTNVPKKRAWILLCSAEQFDKREQAWKEIIDCTLRWDHETAAVRHVGEQFTRAVLYTFSVTE